MGIALLLRSAGAAPLYGAPCAQDGPLPVLLGLAPALCSRKPAHRSPLRLGDPGPPVRGLRASRQIAVEFAASVREGFASQACPTGASAPEFRAGVVGWAGCRGNTL